MDPRLVFGSFLFLGVSVTGYHFYNTFASFEGRNVRRRERLEVGRERCLLQSHITPEPLFQSAFTGSEDRARGADSQGATELLKKISPHKNGR